MGSRSQQVNTAAVFATGALIGAAVALLFAPQSGEKTRKDIRRIGNKAKDTAEELQQEVQATIDSWVDDLADTLHRQFGRGQEWTAEKRCELARALQAGGSFIREKVEQALGG